MKERPILFSGEMVRAILEGRKTQTRRVCDWQPQEKASIPHFIESMMSRFRFGKRGDRLWVRETIDLNRSPKNPRAISPTFRADGTAVPMGGGFYVFPKGTTCPSIFMPRWASRITLEVVNVRVERVQDISEADAIAEGIQGCIDTTGMSSLRIGAEKYRELWDCINAKRGYGWAKNPWVWVIEFKRIKAGGRPSERRAGTT